MRRPYPPIRPSGAAITTMNTPSLGLAIAFGHVAARILVTSLVLSLVAALALTSALALWSVLDVAFYVVDSVHASAIVAVAGL